MVNGGMTYISAGENGRKEQVSLIKSAGTWGKRYKWRQAIEHLKLWRDTEVKLFGKLRPPKIFSSFYVQEDWKSHIQVHTGHVFWKDLQKILNFYLGLISRLKVYPSIKERNAQAHNLSAKTERDDYCQMCNSTIK